MSARQDGPGSRVFHEYFDDGKWFDGETHSGRGSTLAYTRRLRLELPVLLQAFGVRSMLDAPCGDFNWMAHVALPRSLDYIGGDVVEGLIAHNRERFAGPGRSFQVLDVTGDPLPSVDVWMLRDCLFHFSFDDILATLRNFERSDIPLLLTTSYFAARRNVDVDTGGYRQLNLEIEPFGFPPPLAQIDDWVEGSGRRRLSLWHRRWLPAVGDIAARVEALESAEPD